MYTPLVLLPAAPPASLLCAVCTYSSLCVGFGMGKKPLSTCLYPSSCLYPSAAYLKNWVCPGGACHHLHCLPVALHTFLPLLYLPFLFFGVGGEDAFLPLLFVLSPLGGRGLPPSCLPAHANSAFCTSLPLYSFCWEEWRGSSATCNCRAPYALLPSVLRTALLSCVPLPAPSSPPLRAAIAFVSHQVGLRAATARALPCHTVHCTATALFAPHALRLRCAAPAAFRAATRTRCSPRRASTLLSVPWEGFYCILDSSLLPCTSYLYHLLFDGPSYSSCHPHICFGLTSLTFSFCFLGASSSQVPLSAYLLICSYSSLTEKEKRTWCRCLYMPACALHCLLHSLSVHCALR